MEESYAVLRALISSRIRMDILASLDSPMRLSDLRRIVEASAPNTSSNAKDLERMGLVERNSGDYKITQMGAVIKDRLSLLVETVETLYEHEEFWIKILENLPEELLKSVHMFKGAKLVRNDRSDLDRVKRELLKNIMHAEEELSIVLPVRSEEILKSVTNVSKKIHTKLVTLSDNPELHYGLISSKGCVVIFTEMLDMALVKNQNNAAIPMLC